MNRSVGRKCKFLLEFKYCHLHTATIFCDFNLTSFLVASQVDIGEKII
jgi:hypothetical protein